MYANTVFTMERRGVPTGGRVSYSSGLYLCALCHLELSQFAITVLSSILDRSSLCGLSATSATIAITVLAP